MTNLGLALLQGKRVLVTGGGRGIGRAIALICHDHGAKVVITARTKSELEETIRLAEGSTRIQQSAMAAKLLSKRKNPRKSISPIRKTSVGDFRSGSASKARTNNRSAVSQLVDAVKTGSSTTAEASSSRITYYLCDVTDESQVETTVETIRKEEGPIDILINNAGGSQSPKGPVGTLESNDLERLLRLNVMGPNLVAAAFCKQLANDSEKVILNVSSKAGKVGLENYSFYVATKFALEGLASSWAKELKSKNVRVHSLSPGMVNTQSFPKPPGKPGVREASSIRDILLLILTGKSLTSQGSNDDALVVVKNMMDYTGHYAHVDEYDQVIREKGPEAGHLAFKPIDEPSFRV